jgi:hypothetical protein
MLIITLKSFGRFSADYGTRITRADICTCHKKLVFIRLSTSDDGQFILGTIYFGQKLEGKATYSYVHGPSMVCTRKSKLRFKH